MTKIYLHLEDKDKYNFPKLQQIEANLGEPSDRTAYDVGVERESTDHSHVFDFSESDSTEPY